MNLDFRGIEEKWRGRWERSRVFEPDPAPEKEKKFVTFPFPYMSGPLHVGHAFTLSRIDSYARYLRMRGYNVLFPWAWHWTGETVAGASERIRIGDEKFIRALVEVDGVPPEELQKFVEPEYMARYYTDYNRVAVKKIGASIDWRREFHTTSLHPQFSKFVEWQYARLRDGGYVSKGTHPVVWCPRCKSPTGAADRLVGEGITPEEYVLMKFKFGEGYLPCATLRPETIYGVTNLWINPEAEYVEAKVGGELWIVSKRCSEKLVEQLRIVEILRNMKGGELVGKQCASLIDGRPLWILPASFVNPDNASGVVYSVPSHAPYDLLGLLDLQRKPEMLAAFDVSPNILDFIGLISIIRVEGFGDHPAKELVESSGVKDQFDPKADEITKMLYKKEFHTGVLKENCGPYAGLSIRDVKERIIGDLRAKGIVDSMYDLTQPVTCRCTTPCTVKILEGQWFLNYSDPVWKEKAKKLVSGMRFYPEEARKWFLDVIDWLHEWACTRKTGLGTPLPWSPDWIVETLSDSTIYNAYYPVSKYVNALGIRADQLPLEFFDYIYYGKGDPEVIGRSTGLDVVTIEQMRQEFLYWYPVDLRLSGKDLVPNHLTFFIFQHAALFPEQYWPKSISVNGFMLVEGETMHKSKGNFIPLVKAVDQYGADPTRCTVLLAAEGMDDPDWRAENLKAVRSNLESFYRLSQEILAMGGGQAEAFLESWLMSSVQRKIKKVAESMEVLKTRTAADSAFYEVWNDIRWYLRRAASPNGRFLREILSIWVRMVSPFAPFVCEEIWESMRGDGFIAQTRWPEYDQSLVDAVAEEAEALVRNTLDDTLNVVRATKISPKRIFYYYAAEWKWEVLRRVAEDMAKETFSIKAFVADLLRRPEFRGRAREVSTFVVGLVEQLREIPEERRAAILKLSSAKEREAIESARGFLSKELGAEAAVQSEEDASRYDPRGRAKEARPLRPAIYIE